MKVTLHNYDPRIARKMVEKLIELIEIRENVKIHYKIIEKNEERGN